jgi:hypothetical protein
MMPLNYHPLLNALLASASLLFTAAPALSEETPLAKKALIGFEFQISDTNEHLESLIRESNLATRLDAFISNNLTVAHPLTYYFAEDASDLREQPHQIAMSYRLLNTAYQSILDKHPLQPDIQEQHFLQVVEYVMWREFGRTLFRQNPNLLAKPADETVLDQFAMIMLMHQPDSGQQFQLDAVETFLVSDKQRNLPKDAAFKAEIEYDEHRYRQLVCLVLGADYQPIEGMVEELAWDDEKQKQCRDTYRQALDYWLQTLAPVLKPDNQLQQWRFSSQNTVQ